MGLNMQGNDSEESVIELRLPNGSSVAVRVKEATTGAEKTSLLGALEFKDIVESIAGISEALGEVLHRCQPTKASVNFGLELSAKSGKLMALLVDGEGKGTLNVGLEWSKEAGHKPT